MVEKRVQPEVRDLRAYLVLGFGVRVAGNSMIASFYFLTINRPLLASTQQKCYGS